MSYNTPLSFWEKDAYLNHLDVVIVGGGLVGMNAALHLANQQPSLKIAIVEQSSLGTGASTRNAGFACFGSPSEILSDLENMDQSEVFDLVKRRVDGLRQLRRIVGDDNMNYVRNGGYEVFLNRNEYEKHLDRLDEINGPLQEIDPKLKFYKTSRETGVYDIAGIIGNDWEGQLHPGRMVHRLRQLCYAKNIRILTNLKVGRIDNTSPFKIACGSIELKSKRVILCTNGYSHRLLEQDAPTPGRNQVLLTSDIPNLKLRGCFHYDSGYVYFRNVGNRILIGGGRNKALEKESTDEFGTNAEIRTYLIDILNRHIIKEDAYQIETSWSGILGFNKTKTPTVKALSPGIFIAAGLGGMGVAIGTLVGKEVADLLLQS